MDIKTKFSVGDACLFLMAHKNDLTNVEIIEATIHVIDIKCTDDGHRLTYIVKDNKGSEIEMSEDKLSSSHKELIEYIFRAKNVRTFTSKKHKISNGKASDNYHTDDLQEIFRDLAGNHANLPYLHTDYDEDARCQ